MESIGVHTQRKTEFVDITQKVQETLSRTGAQSGVLHLFVPHTTAGVTLNENMDPAVIHDMLGDLDRLIPEGQSHYRHMEANSAAHLKASLMGASLCIPVVGGALVLGPWQGVYLCEFDGPRSRRVHLQFVGQEDGR